MAKRATLRKKNILTLTNQNRKRIFDCRAQNFQIKKLINKYICRLKQRGIKASKVILFGSYAKGTAQPDSDIDIAVISSQFGQNNFKEMIFLRKLALEIDLRIEPLPFSPQDIEDRYSALAQEIKKYGVLI